MSTLIDSATTNRKDKLRSSMNGLPSVLLLFAIFWIASAASFSGYIAKWGLLDGRARNSVEMMLEGTAHRPFVYRQLIPALANFADHHLPAEFKRGITNKHNIDEIYGKASGYAKEDLRFRYLIVYYSAFLALFGSMFVLHRIVLDHGAGQAAAVLAPVALALAMPYLQTVGGYFYDNVELLFMSITFWLALRGKNLLLFAVLVPATLNKETFFFYLPALYPLFRLHGSRTMSACITGIAILIAGAVNLFIKHAYAANPGAAAEYQLWANIKQYLTPWFYKQTEITYGLLGPAGMSLITVTITAVLIWRGWKGCRAYLKQHVLLAAAINIPLFLTFAATGELRNLSLLFVGLVVVLAKAIEYSFARQVPAQR